MDNLYEEYRRVFETGKLFYYDDLKTEYENKGIDSILDNSEEFIKAYFKTGEKGGALNNKLLEELKVKKRLPHVVSSFILGIILKDRIVVLKSALDKKCKEFHRLLIEECKQNGLVSGLCDPFTFTWFLTCLGHDIGYLFEYEDATKKPSLLIDSIENVDNYISDREMEEYLPPAEHAIVPMQLKNNCVNYYKAGIVDGDKFREKKCRDHGVSGGIVYYNLLKKNYEKVKKDSVEHKKSDCFFKNGRLWSKKILATYIAAGSWAIICHNMWRRKKNDTNKTALDTYKSRGLGELITNEPLIKVHEHPFLFLLALADTLEPIKKSGLQLKTIKDILEGTKISIKKDKLFIKSHPKENLDLEFLGYEKKGQTYRIC